MNRTEWLGAVAKHFGICPVQYAALADVFDDPESWFLSAHLEGTRVVRVPSPVPAITVYLSRAAAGALLARHRHAGRESVLVLQGGFREVGGRHAGPGEVMVSERGSEHAILVDDDIDCICAVRLEAESRDAAGVTEDTSAPSPTSAGGLADARADR